MRVKFRELTRPQQRLNLLRRMNLLRRTIEEYLRDLAAWNALCESRGRPGDRIEDRGMVRLLAKVDQEIRQIRDSR